MRISETGGGGGGGGGDGRVRWEEGVGGHMGRVGGDGDGREMRKGDWKGIIQKCKGIISRCLERGKCMRRGDGASPPVICQSRLATTENHNRKLQTFIAYVAPTNCICVKA